MMELSTAMINISRDPTCTHIMKDEDEENRHIYTVLY
jgi:hypothetical protein